MLVESTCCGTSTGPGVLIVCESSARILPEGSTAALNFGAGVDIHVKSDVTVNG